MPSPPVADRARPSRSHGLGNCTPLSTVRGLAAGRTARKPGRVAAEPADWEDCCCSGRTAVAVGGLLQNLGGLLQNLEGLLQSL